MTLALSVTRVIFWTTLNKVNVPVGQACSRIKMTGSVTGVKAGTAAIHAEMVTATAQNARRAGLTIVGSVSAGRLASKAVQSANHVL